MAQALVPDVEQPYRVPDNWCWTRVKHLCFLKNGRAFKPSDWSITGLPIIRIQNLNDPDNEYNYFDGKVSDDNRLFGGELLFAWSGTPGTSFGAHIWHGKDAVLNQHIFRVDFDEKNIDKKFFMYAINQQLDLLISSAHGGAGLQHVTKGVFEATPIAFPPLAEQQRIVDRIESLFAKLDEAKEKSQAVVDGFEDRRAAILHKAFTGELTAQWRKSFHGADWERTKLGTYLKPMETKKPAGNRFLYIDIDSIDNKRQEVRAPKDTLVKDAPSRASRAVHHGDVLFSMVRPYLKNIALIDESLQECIASTGFYVCTPKSGLDSKYLYYLLCSKDAIDYLMQFMKGDNSPSIRKDDLLNMQIMLPSNPEQIQIVQILDDVLEHEQRAKEAAEQVIDQIDAMKKSILARAFRGELGTNDPTDESAVELLKRVL